MGKTLLEKIQDLHLLRETIKEKEKEIKFLQEDIIKDNDFIKRLNWKEEADIGWVIVSKMYNVQYKIIDGKMEDFKKNFPANVKETPSVAWLTDDVKNEYFTKSLSPFLKINL